MYETIMRHLTDVLLPDLQLTVNTQQDELLNQHNVFMASRCNIYVHRDAYLPLLNKQLMTGRCIIGSLATSGTDA